MNPWPKHHASAVMMTATRRSGGAAVAAYVGARNLRESGAAEAC